MAKAYLVIRIKGQADVPHWAARTLSLLRLERKFRATIVPARDNTLGMLNKVKHYVAWNEAGAEITRELLDKKGRREGYRRITGGDLESIGYKSIDELAESLSEGRVSMGRVRPIKPWFALAPPRRGFKRSTKKMYSERGVLGHNRELDELVRRMI